MTPRDRALLLVLAEEAAEVVQACTKLLRFGDRIIPEGHDGAGKSNIEHLAIELDDIRATVELLQGDGWPLETNLVRITRKIERVERRLKESIQLGKDNG